MAKTGTYHQNVLAWSVNFVFKWNSWKTFWHSQWKAPKSRLCSAISFSLFCCIRCLFSIYSQVLFSCQLRTHSAALVYHVGFYALITLRASFQVAWKKNKSQYEFMKQCMNKSFPALNTPLSKWSRDFSRTIYITVADTVFKFSCQSQNGILNHPIFLNEVSEF